MTVHSPAAMTAEERARASRLASFGLGLVLLSLGVLFVASMVSYVLLRLRSDGPDLGSVPVPKLLWLSTAIMLATSFTIHQSAAGLGGGALSAARGWLLATFALAVAFVGVQTPALMQLYETHRASLPVVFPPPEARPMEPSGMMLVLIVLHAFHVLGGLVPLSLSMVRLLGGVYRPGESGPLTRLAAYWHFLDAVWIVMFGLFLFAG